MLVVTVVRTAKRATRVTTAQVSRLDNIVVIQGKLTYEPIGFELLDKKFPFSELEKLYKTILGRPIDRRNFKKKIMKFGFLVETKQKQKHAGSGRPGFLYRFNEKRYFQLKKEGINFEI